MMMYYFPFSQVISISETSARTVLTELPNFSDAMVVATAYGFNCSSDWLIPLHHQVIQNQSRTYWEDFSNNMSYSPEIFTELVQMLHTQKHSKRELEMLKLVLKQCKDKSLLEEVSVKRSRSGY